MLWVDFSPLRVSHVQRDVAFEHFDLCTLDKLLHVQDKPDFERDRSDLDNSFQLFLDLCLHISELQT